MESYSEKNLLNWLRNDRIMVMSLWPRFLAHPAYYNARRILLQSDTKNAFSRSHVQMHFILHKQYHNRHNGCTRTVQINYLCRA